MILNSGLDQKQNSEINSINTWLQVYFPQIPDAAQKKRIINKVHDYWLYLIWSRQESLSHTDMDEKCTFLKRKKEKVRGETLW